MERLDQWRLSLPDIRDRLGLGVESFGAYASWLEAIPVVWTVTLILLWLHATSRERRRGRVWPSDVARHLPLRRRFDRHRFDRQRFDRQRDDEVPRLQHDPRTMARALAGNGPAAGPSSGNTGAHRDPAQPSTP